MARSCERAHVHEGYQNFCTYLGRACTGAKLKKDPFVRTVCELGGFEPQIAHTILTLGDIFEIIAVKKWAGSKY